ncbi:MAG: efflux RND transporter periplasmic adaptor subunit [Alphaproteobacteria bacterium]|nr:efflux RND transporter periplasmic adaptor subunit [Alphaproteobacteria bacterium]
MTKRRLAKTAIAALAVGAGVVAVAMLAGGTRTGAEGPAAAPAPMAMPVDAITVRAEAVRLWVTYSARLEAVQEAEIRPQVSGEIIEVRFKDGQRAAKGDVLFVIDPRPYEAAVAGAKADLAAARDRFSYARKELKRARSLVKTSAVSKRVLDERVNAFAVARSEVDGARARLARAEIDLGHAFVKAPIAGRASRAEITVGNLVTAGPASPLLTTIVSDGALYADFDVDEATYLRFLRDGARGLAAEQRIPVRLNAGGAGGIEAEGHIHSFDNRIDRRTGTIRARALFSSPDPGLVPGMYVQVQIGSPEARERILLTERAILTDQDRKFVYVVSEGNKAAYREVRLGAQLGTRRVIEDGLKAGEQVITSNLLILQPNAPIVPKDGTDGAASGGPGQASPATDTR